MLQKFKSLSGLIIFLIILFVFAACQRYYMTTARNVKDNPDQTLDSLKNESRYFVLRNGSEAYYMKNIVLSDDRQTLGCLLDTLPPEHKLHLLKGRNGNMRYNLQDIPVLTEVHLYISSDKLPSVGDYTLSLDQIQKIEVIEKDKKRTLNSYVLGTLGVTVGVTVGVFTLAAIIVAATKSSCPFVSAYDGEKFSLQGEIFGGAIYPQLVRHDYLPLKMKTTANGNLQLKISNELQERQYTDMAELVVIKHDKNTKVLCNEEGKLYSVQKLQAPAAATLSGKKDVKDLLLREDNRLLYFDDSTAHTGNNDLVLEFNKERSNTKGKLILSLKNSYWLDYLYGELAKGFGKRFTAYTAKQRQKPAAELHKWTKEQRIPLEVSFKTNEGWRKITDITTIGPVALREIVVPVDLSSVKNSKVEIKLSSGYLFWELDYAAIDFSADTKMDAEILKPFTAHDESGKDVLEKVSKEDNQFLEQPLPGTVATLEYKWQPVNTSAEAYTFILHTKGYYEHVRNFEGSADIKFLTQFKKPGAFPRYSLQRFKEFNKEQMKYLSKK